MKRSLFVAVALVLVAGLGLLAQAEPKRPIRFEDFFGFARVSDPQISPDGSRIAFTVTRFDIEANRSNSDLWIVPTDGSAPPRPLTTDPKGDSSARWSPDGSTLAFVSTRDGTPQIWLLPLTGGEPRRLTSLSTGASGPVWSPDGKHLLFTSSVWPDCANDDEARKRAEEAAEVPARIADGLLYRHWNEWRDGKVSHLFLVAVEDGAARDLTPGTRDVPPISLGGDPDYAFAPDGSEICFVANPDPVVAVSTNNDLFVYPLPDGPARRITTNPGNDNSPRYSPDGRWIAYRSMERAGFEADRNRLRLLDRTRGETVELSEGMEYSVDDVLWSPDSSTIYFTAPWHGRAGIYAIPAAGGPVRELVTEHTNRSPDLARDGSTLVFVQERIDAPAEIFRMALPEGKPAPATGMNDARLAGLDLQPLRDFWFEGAGGHLVHGLLVTPPDFSPDRKVPLVYLIHGGPQGAWGDEFHYRWNAQMFAAPGYAVAMVNFHGSEGYGQDFTDAVSGDWGGKPYEDLMKGLDYLGKTYPFLDMDRVAGAGASYGGYMVNWILGQEGSRRFRCLVSHAGVYNLESMYGATEELWFPEWEFRGTPWENEATYERWSPHKYASRFRTPTLVVVGELDFRVPYTEGLQLFTALQRQGVPSRLLVFPDEDHFVRKPKNARLWWQTVYGWLADHLGKS